MTSSVWAARAGTRSISFSLLSPISLILSLGALVLALRALRRGESGPGVLGAIGLATLPVLVFAVLGA